MGALDGRVALVTGASRGIGAATARELARAGARVALLARSSEALHRLAEEVGRGALPVPVDLTDAPALDRALAALHREVGSLHIVVNNAGAFSLGAVGELGVDQVAQMQAVNVMAPYRLLHTLIPAMRAHGEGHLVHVGSIADHVAFPNNAGYAASKYGMRAIHEVLSVELRGTGVRTTLISPGPTDTDIWGTVQPNEADGLPARAQMLRASDVAEAIVWAVSRPAHVQVSEIRLGYA